MARLVSSPVCSANVLAAEDGQCLQPRVDKLRGDDLLKQSLDIIGKCSILEHTLHRLSSASVCK
jgi:hypothetical protein